MRAKGWKDVDDMVASGIMGGDGARPIGESCKTRKWVRHFLDIKKGYSITVYVEAPKKAQ